MAIKSLSIRIDEEMLHKLHVVADYEEHRGLPPDDRHTRATECARLRAVTNSRDSWRSHVHRTYTAQRVQPFKPKGGNVSLSLGVPKGVFSFAKENTPFDPAARRRHFFRTCANKREPFFEKENLPLDNIDIR